MDLIVTTEIQKTTFIYLYAFVKTAENMFPQTGGGFLVLPLPQLALQNTSFKCY
jgi:hypothetical protein